ncbi:MAG: BofC C-terminal domain-containing protein [Clostridia bacterium]|nr:BofC C-terminal domain-containing protein [Clostridia bacterium]
MKKWIYIIAIIIIVVVAIFVGKYLFKKENNINQQNSTQLTNKIEVKNEVQENTLMNDIPISSTQSEKISPNATLILKKHYKECNHIIKEYAKIPEEYVNLTKEELMEEQDGWEIESFSKNEIVLIKEVSGVCNEHYVLREKDGTIVVYQINKDNTETLKEETGIATEYLTEEDRLRLKEGIRIYGNEELNSTLEDYE